LVAFLRFGVIAVLLVRRTTAETQRLAAFGREDRADDTPSMTRLSGVVTQNCRGESTQTTFWSNTATIAWAMQPASGVIRFSVFNALAGVRQTHRVSLWKTFRSRHEDDIFSAPRDRPCCLVGNQIVARVSPWSIVATGRVFALSTSIA